ncbi:hypothetical protein Nepgr_029029 [Nepenthes gracilis]|uniref:HEAT repeat-containing protein 5B n=1 Tax=Nepenthes gracilis TaxID=150966 RepID=A0AAD3TE38_NEPGR|nr:hypothetical protein Nepgr_029029 [Nepenthes gracilis]
MARKNYVRENVPLSRFGVLVAQLESIVVSAAQQSPDPLLCFDLLSDLITAIDEEPKESVLLWQRKCEDALYSLLGLGARRPVRHLASVAMARIIVKGDPISVYSRVSSLQGFLSDGKRSEPHGVAGAAQCLGELYRLFARRTTSGLPETISIASKLMRYHEEYVRKEALNMLQNALEGSGGAAVSAAYMEAFRLILRLGVGDKSFIVRIAAARCLKAFANIGGPGLGVAELENSASSCVKVLDDPVSSVRDAFAEALGALLALGMNPESQVQPRAKGPSTPEKKLESFLQRHLVFTFVKATGLRSRDLRIGLALSWVSFLQAIRLKNLHPDTELQDFALQVMDMLQPDASVDAQALACVLYILRVGVTDQMTEPTQRSFLVVLGKQLQSSDVSPAMKVAALRTLSYTLKTLGEVPVEFKEVLDETIVAALSHSSQLVRVEAALTLQALAEVDPTCVGGLISFGVATLCALRESVSFERGSNFKMELDSLHGQATVLAALVSISPKLALGYPARLPKSVLEVSKKMLTESSRSPGAATVEKESGWLLLSSLLASMPKEELEDQVFDILTLWAPIFSGNSDHEVLQNGDLKSKLCVWASAVDALTAFVRCFISPYATNNGILLQPVLVYLSCVLSYISLIAAKELPNTNPALDMLIIRLLMAFQSISDPMAYRSDHPQILQLCTAPFRNAPGFEESSCLRSLLNKRDSWLGPWIPGRDWFEDELRAFQGGKDGLMPCVWDPELPSFPQPVTVSKMLVNQMLLCFGIMFAFQDSNGMLSLLCMVEQCLKAGRKQSWHATSVTNVCAGLLAGLKALLTFRLHPLGSEILSSFQAIFQGILAEGDICPSQRRASAEGLGLLTRLGNDSFTVRMTKSLLGDLSGATDSNYSGSIAMALGCIHRSAGGMTLSSLVPATVNSISSLARSSVSALQIWYLHGLLLTIEAAGLSFVSHVQATLSLALEILLLEENGWVDLLQGVGRLINAVVAVLGPELAPDSIFFSRCKFVVAEISSCQETAVLLESVRFTQQLVLFAPQALSVRLHVQTLLTTLSSRQPTLRHLAISTLLHLIEKDPVSVIAEQIEGSLFDMLDEETDTEVENLVRSTIMRLLYASCPSCPSHWMSICRKIVLAVSSRNSEMNSSIKHDPTSSSNDDAQPALGEDDENMVSSANHLPYAFDASVVLKRDKHLRHRTRVFAAECLSHLPTAVGQNTAHFDLSLARKQPGKGQPSCDWLVLHLQELISLAYQISTIQFENIQPIGVRLLSTIIDKFKAVEDPELPGCLLLEQYQAQLVSALRSALDTSSGPVLLEEGLQLATKMLTGGIIRWDQAAVKRIFSLISKMLDDFKELYYPSFAEWVSCKIKIRLLAAHASLKCYTYTFLRRHNADVPDECLALLPLFSKSSSILGKYWIGILKDYCNICFNLHFRKNWRPFLDGIQSPLVSSKLRLCLEEAWPVILSALVLDVGPLKINMSTSSDRAEQNILKQDYISGYNMVELDSEEFRFIWGLALLILFQGKNPAADKQLFPLASVKSKSGDSPAEETKVPSLKIYEVALPVFQFFCTDRFFKAGFLSVDICRELLQVFTYAGFKGDSWNSLAVAVLVQIVENCPEDYLNTESFTHSIMELCLGYLFKMFKGTGATSPNGSSREDLILQLFITTRTLLSRFEPKKQLQSIMAFILIAYKCIRGASTEWSFSKINEFVLSTSAFLKTFIGGDKSDQDEKIILQLQMILGACQNAIANLTMDCIEGIHLLENKNSRLRKLVHTKLAFGLEQTLFFADLIYKIELLQGSKCVNSVNMAIFADCTKCIKIVFADANIQVQAIGLQVLKNTLQKKAVVKGDSFVVILTGELSQDILMVVQKLLNKPLSRESAALAGECLKTLMLMQSLPKGIDCQKGLMNLLLEAIVMVLSGTEDGLSEEISDIRSTATKLVSYLAQIPSATVLLKDVLLGMPATHRQQIQGIIRASVTQQHSALQARSTAPALEIKLPLQSERNEVENSHSDENDQDEDDDWDAFQSFHPSTTTPAADSDSEQPLAANSSISELNSQTDVIQNYSRPHPSNEEGITVEHHQYAAEEVFNDSDNDPVSSDSLPPVEDAKGWVEANLKTDNEIRVEIEDGSSYLEVSSDSSPIKGLSSLKAPNRNSDQKPQTEESSESARDPEPKSSTASENIDQH